LVLLIAYPKKKKEKKKKKKKRKKKERKSSGLVPELTPKMCTREMRFFQKKTKTKNLRM
jgi:hypothetical protein